MSDRGGGQTFRQPGTASGDRFVLKEAEFRPAVPHVDAQQEFRHPTLPTGPCSAEISSRNERAQAIADHRMDHLSAVRHECLPDNLVLHVRVRQTLLTQVDQKGGDVP